MKKVIVIFISLMTFAACDKKVESGNKDYFDFDEVIHYNTDVKELDLFAIREKKVKTPKDSVLLNMVWNYYSPIPNNRMVAYLDSVGFDRSVIPSSKFVLLKEIFKENHKILESSTMCEPVYRNIFIFKKQGKVSGVARICYTCMKSVFSGTKANTNNFGANGEYEKLQKLSSEMMNISSKASIN